MVARVNTKLDERTQLDPARVREIAKERDYDLVFFSTLGRIERNAEKGTYTPEPYEYLITGRVAREPQLDMGEDMDPANYFTPISKRREAPQQLAGMLALERSAQKLEESIAARRRSQEVPKVVEIVRERVREIVPEKSQEWER